VIANQLIKKYRTELIRRTGRLAPMPLEADHQKRSSASCPVIANQLLKKYRAELIRSTGRLAPIPLKVDH
jgi:hypothetical protein